MAKEVWERDASGKYTGIRITSDDSRTSWLYEVDETVTGILLHGAKGKCTEVAEHHEDGTTDAYEHDDSLIGQLFYGGKGKHK